ncbi:MarR family winged helix-turn-helix transcriptional regulator [Pedobacter sp. BMA]|uniref:MarR family winged helix-turn-helix transcriptional regulator n=1 Tax=Pedobacter sp. BMA TaxID=1663685 RepID=UPI00064B6D44|nr:MarR family transcriptional regulator [Pedobacter sp. BMA]KLT63706.1 MarR family transcriptional regulator [Pedobacter sp. BMA]
MEEFYKLEDQLCFPLYAASRLVTKCYQPVLDEMGITYPQYLALMVLWENNHINLGVLSDKLKLQSNTLTPLIKRMEETGLLNRARSDKDERSIIISLTDKGSKLQSQAPKLHQRIRENLGINEQEAKELKRVLDKMILNLS